MELKAVGSTPLKVAPIVFGGNVFGWTADRKQSFELLDVFVANGFNCVDTANVYSRFAPGLAGGESESLIGEWLIRGPGRREKLVLCTKVGMEMAPAERGLSAAYIERAAEASLKRLRTDRIDLYISHVDDPDTPLEETLGAYDRLIRAGKVRAIGASNYSADRLGLALSASKSLGVPGYQSLQPLYNLYDRDTYEGALAQVCHAHGLAVFPYFALASGFLTGKYRDKATLAGSARSDFVARYLDDHGLRVLAALDTVASARQRPLAQIALAWLLARPGVTAPIASATSRKQLEEILPAVEIRLRPEEIRQLDIASNPSSLPNR
ncbi:MAG: aldo/keto reductase [Steroidobacteraceae bacterium]